MTLEFIVKNSSKTISTLVEHFKQEDIPLDEASLKRVMNMVYRKYQESWGRLYEVLSAQYKILDNYAMKESETIDRETYENNQRDILRDMSTNNRQVSELLEKIKQNESNKHERTGFDETTGERIGKDITASQDERDTSHTDNKTDTLTFQNRQDKETRDLTKTTRGDNDVSTNMTDTLSFNNREDTTTGNQTNSSTGRDETNRTESNTMNKNEESKDSEYGYGTNTTAEGTPKTRREALSLDDSSVEGSDTKNSTTSGRADTLDKVKKTGSESTNSSGTVNTTTYDNERDTGTLTQGKTGSEVNTETASGSTKDIGSRNDTTDRRDNSTDKTQYNTTDNTTAEHLEDNTRSNTNTDTGSETESTGETSESQGNANEVRTLERTGNIGVTTSVAMLREHVDFWKFSFLEHVYQDVAKELTLPIYE